VIMCARLS